MPHPSKKYDVEVEKVLKEVASYFAEEMLEKLPYMPSPLMPLESYQRKLQYEAAGEVSIFLDRIINGLKEIENAFDIIPSEVKELIQQFLNNQILFQQIVLKSLLEEPASPIKTQMQMPDKATEALWIVGSKIFNEGKYKGAAEVFCVMTLLEPKKGAYWMGLGNAEYFLERYRPALIAYAYAIQANPCNPLIHLYSAHCYEKLKEYSQALNSIDLALYVIQSIPEQSEWEQKTLDYKNYIKKTYL